MFRRKGSNAIGDVDQVAVTIKGGIARMAFSREKREKRESKKGKGREDVKKRIYKREMRQEVKMRLNPSMDEEKECVRSTGPSIALV